MLWHWPKSKQWNENWLMIWTFQNKWGLIWVVHLSSTSARCCSRCALQLVHIWTNLCPNVCIPTDETKVMMLCYSQLDPNWLTMTGVNLFVNQQFSSHWCTPTLCHLSPPPSPLCFSHKFCTPACAVHCQKTIQAPPPSLVLGMHCPQLLWHWVAQSTW